MLGLTLEAAGITLNVGTEASAVILPCLAVTTKVILGVQDLTLRAKVGAPDAIVIFGAWPNSRSRGCRWNETSPLGFSRMRRRCGGLREVESCCVVCGDGCFTSELAVKLRNLCSDGGSVTQKVITPVVLLFGPVDQ